jgi:hypothetical protein
VTDVPPVKPSAPRTLRMACRSIAHQRSVMRLAVLGLVYHCILPASRRGIVMIRFLTAASRIIGVA